MRSLSRRPAPADDPAAYDPFASLPEPDAENRDRRRRRVLGILSAGALAVVAVYAVIRDPGHPPCRPIVMVVGASSSERSEAFVDQVGEVLGATAERTAVCESLLRVFAVHGVEPTLVLQDADLGSVTDGDDFDDRQENVDEDELAGVVEATVAAIYAEDTGGDVSSLAALYAAAAPHGQQDLLLLIATDGVENSDDDTLNRALAEGEGTEFTDGIDVMSVEAKSVAVFGVTLVDAQTSAPGQRWADEVIAANEALCHKATDLDCDVYSAASAADLID